MATKQKIDREKVNYLTNVIYGISRDIINNVPGTYPDSHLNNLSIYLRSYEDAHFFKRPDTCECCGKVVGWDIEGHHPDYSKPFLRMWLCRKCHRRVHGQLQRVETVAYLKKSVAELVAVITSRGAILPKHQAFLNAVQERFQAIQSVLVPICGDEEIVREKQRSYYTQVNTLRKNLQKLQTLAMA